MHAEYPLPLAAEALRRGQLNPAPADALTAARRALRMAGEVHDVPADPLGRGPLFSCLPLEVPILSAPAAELSIPTHIALPTAWVLLPLSYGAAVRYLSKTLPKRP